MSDSNLDVPSGAGPATQGVKNHSTPINVLILEDRPEDAELMAYELRRSGFEPACQRLETEPEFLQGLMRVPDVILADYHMPHLDAPRALELLHSLGVDIPLIVVSGVIGEDAAVAMMRQGATDYVLKDRLKRLGPAVKRALAEKRLREDKRQAEHALRASEARFFSFMKHSPALAYIKDGDGRILYMNNTCEQVWTQSLAHREGTLDHPLRPAEEAARMRVEDLSVIGGGQPSRTIEELTLPGGGVRHLLSYRFPFEDGAGCRMLGGMSMDITEQMRIERDLAIALAAKETLLKEVHHRVKNNLQIVSSLLNMQAELLADPGQRLAFQESQQRVQSMAMIHEMLCRNADFERVSLREYVDALARNLFSAYGVDRERVRLRLALRPVWLGLNQAIPCGLILNELVSNALKYAFPGDRRGSLLIGLNCDAADRVTLRVADNGVGIEGDPGPKQSLGLGIVDVLARQLGGTLQRAPGPGVGISLVFKKGGHERDPGPAQTKASRAGR